MRELVADEVPLGAEDVGDDHVARLQHVDRGLVAGRCRAFGLGVGLVHLDDVAPRRHELDGEDPPDHLLVRLQDLPAVARLELVGKPPARQHGLHFLGDQDLQPLEHLVGDFRAAVGEPIVRVLRGVFDELFRRPLKELRGCQVDRCQQRDEHERRERDARARNDLPETLNLSSRHVSSRCAAGVRGPGSSGDHRGRPLGVIYRPLRGGSTPPVANMSIQVADGLPVPASRRDLSDDICDLNDRRRLRVVVPFTPQP